MKTEKHTQQKLPFAAEKDSFLFYQEVVRLLIKEVDNRRKRYVPTENFQIFYHGLGWSFQRRERDGFKPHTGELEKVTTDCQIGLDRIIANDVTLISDFVRETANRMEEGLVQRLFQEMASVTEETGAAVSISKEGSIADAFLKAVKTTQMGVTADGQVSAPTFFHTDPNLLERLNREIAERGPEFQKQIEDARKKQEEEALTREAERLARYDNLE